MFITSADRPAMRSTPAAGHDGATATSSVHATAITSGNASQITKCGWSISPPITELRRFTECNTDMEWRWPVGTGHPRRALGLAPARRVRLHRWGIQHDSDLITFANNIGEFVLRIPADRQEVICPGPGEQ
jgi:hypothetical protein